MRKWLGSLIIVALLLVPAFVFAAEDSVDSHPIFSEKNWVYSTSRESYFIDPDGTTEVNYMKIEYYKHSNGKYFMAIFTVFGEEVVRSYGADDENGNSQKWIQVEKDGKLYTAKMKGFEIIVVKDDNEKITSLVYILKDENGKEVIRREVKRK